MDGVCGVGVSASMPERAGGVPNRSTPAHPQRATQESTHTRKEGLLGMPSGLVVEASRGASREQTARITPSNLGVMRPARPCTVCVGSVRSSRRQLGLSCGVCVCVWDRTGRGFDVCSSVCVCVRRDATARQDSPQLVGQELRLGPTMCECRAPSSTCGCSLVRHASCGLREGRLFAKVSAK